MTLKKFLKKLDDIDKDNIELKIDGNYVGFPFGTPCNESLRQKYADYKIEKFYPFSYSVDRPAVLTIHLKPPKQNNPKRSTDDKAYKKWMKKYVKDHMDEAAGYDDGCWNCKYTDLDSGSFPCKECSHAYVDKWKSKE